MKITFRGLATFVRDGDGYALYLLRGGSGMHEHHPTLTCPIRSGKKRYVNIDPALTTWLPDRLGYDEQGNQIGMWDLQGNPITFDLRLGGAPKPTEWADRGDAIDLAHWHSGDNLTPRDKAGVLATGATSVAIVGGALVCGTKQARTVFKGGKEQTPPKSWPIDITWTSDAKGDVQIISPKGAIELYSQAALAITNVAPVLPSQSVEHFDHYYNIYMPPVDPAVRLRVEHAHDEVFDCVDPGAGDP